MHTDQASDGQSHLVRAVIQMMEWAETEAKLRQIGECLKHEQMTDGERETLKKKYLERWEALRSCENASAVD